MYNCLQTPRYYTVSDSTNPRTAQQNYSYSYQSTSVRDTNNPYGRPERSSYSSTTERKSATGPGGYNYSTDRTSTMGSRPGDYSYSSTTSGRLPYGIVHIDRHAHKCTHQSIQSNQRNTFIPLMITPQVFTSFIIIMK